MGEDITYEEHVALNNIRLNSIRNSLQDPVTFSTACVELTKWCSDQRAFTSHFEENLLATLQVAMDHGTKETFDFNLTHQLMSACFSHRKHLSPESAVRINRWYEQLRRQKKNGGKRKRAPPKNSKAALAAAAAAAAQNQQNEAMMCDGSSMWNSGIAGSSQTAIPSSHPPPYNEPTMSHYGVSYGQMEGNANMYDQQQQQQQQRMMNSNQYPMPPMGVNQVPGQAHPLMRYPYQAHQSPGYPNHQPMMRPGGPMMYGYHQSMGQQPQQPQQQPQAPPPGSYARPDGSLAAPPDKILVNVAEKILIEEYPLKLGSYGAEFELSPDEFKAIQTNPNVDVLLSYWIPMPTNDMCAVKVFINSQPMLQSNAHCKNMFAKSFIRPGKNLFQVCYESRVPGHVMTLEIVSRKSAAEMRHHLIEKMDQTNGVMNPMQRIQACRMRLHKCAMSQPSGQINIPLFCNLSKRRLATPARHRGCNSISCFDVIFLMASNALTTRYYCQSCSTFFKLQDVEIDFFIGSLIQKYQACQPLVTDVILNRHNEIHPVVKEEPPAKGSRKKKNDSSDDSHTIKRIKSEVLVKQEQQEDYSMPISVPSGTDWSKMGPATPATPSVNPAPMSVGNVLNSPRQQHDQRPASLNAPGSAPYTPASIGSLEKPHELLANLDIRELFGYSAQTFLEDDQLVRQYLSNTKGVIFQEIETRNMMNCDEQHHAATQSNTVTSSTQFTPPWDEVK